LGNGWNLINPANPSRHIDEALYPDGEYWKHISNDGLRHDRYADLKPGAKGDKESDYTCPTITPPPVKDKTNECTAPGVRTYTVTKAEYEWIDGEWVLGEPVVVHTWDKDDASCNVEVTPILTWTTPTCDEDGDITIVPDNEGEGVVWHPIFNEDGSISVTATPEPGYFFPEGTQTSWEIPNLSATGDCPTGIPFSAPTPAPTCTAGATFDAESLGGEFNEESGRWEFDNVNVEVITSVAGEVTLNVFAKAGYVIDEAVEANGWFVEEGGARASRTIILAPATGTQSTNAAAPCYVTPPPGTTPTPGTVVTVSKPGTPTKVYVAKPYLASTGSEGALALAGLAGLLVLAGGSASVLAARRRSTQQ